MSHLLIVGGTDAAILAGPRAREVYPDAAARAWALAHCPRRLEGTP